MDLAILEFLEEGLENLSIARHVMPLDRLLVVDDVPNKAHPCLDDEEEAAATVCQLFSPLLVLLVIFVNQILDDFEIALPVIWVDEFVAELVPVEEPV